MLRQTEFGVGSLAQTCPEEPSQLMPPCHRQCLSPSAAAQQAAICHKLLVNTHTASFSLNMCYIQQHFLHNDKTFQQRYMLRT